MKRLAISIFAVSYLLLTTGIVVNFHYCMDRLASFSFFSSSTKKCASCGMEIHKSGGCCRDEIRIVKMQDDQNRYDHAGLEIAALPAVIAIPSEYLATHFFNFNGQRHFHNHSPPLLSFQDTYLQISVFRI